MCIYLANVEYEWDLAKEVANYSKHGVHFADAIGAFEDDAALSEPDTTSREDRTKTRGVDFLGRLLLVIWTFRDEDTIRLISARLATTVQTRLYERRRR